ncbi:MAG: glycosyltransferase family 2 protein [Anaerolineae bacterium]|nr:glycosyltransferase family 2 protein [Anaerolineae bacterium]
MTPKVTVIVLTYKQRDLTLECLDHLTRLEYPAERLDVVVVDNHSNDATPQAIRDRYQAVVVLETDENLGYAGGNNVGIQYALEQGADYVLLLNDDALVAPDMLWALLAAAEQEPRVGFLGPKVYHLEEPEHLQSAGIMLDSCLRPHQRGQDEVDRGQYESIAECDTLAGCTLFTSRQVIEQVGMLDPRFFMYHEEVDWCLRARAAGFRNLYVPAARAWHPKPQLRQANTAFTTYYMTRNHYLLLSKHGAGIRPLAQITKKHLIWLLNWTLNPKWRHVRQKRDALFQALLDAALRRYGRQRTHYGS